MIVYFYEAFCFEFDACSYVMDDFGSAIDVEFMYGYDDAKRGIH